MYPSLKYSIFCGEPLTQEIANKWKLAAPNSTVENMYGPTETSVFITRYLYKDNDITKTFNNGIVPIGKIFNNQRISVIDEDNQLVSDSRIGELILSGSQVTKGYLDQTETKKSFINMDWDESNDIWYKTGDLGFINNNENYEYVSRIDNQIKIGGRRVEIGEIESILRQFNKCSQPKI